MPVPVYVPKYTPNPRGKYECPECHLEWDSAVALGLHRRKKHGVVSIQARPAIPNRPAGPPFKCDYPGCTYEAVTIQAWGRHRSQLHGLVRGQPAPTSPGAPPMPPANGDGAQRPRRRYTRRNHGGLARRRAHAPELAQPAPASVQVEAPPPVLIEPDGQSLNYCPRCSEPLGHYHDVTGVAPQKCPQCRLSLAPLAVALSPSLQGIEPHRFRSLLVTLLNVAGHLNGE